MVRRCFERLYTPNRPLPSTRSDVKPVSFGGRRMHSHRQAAGVGATAEAKPRRRRTMPHVDAPPSIRHAGPPAPELPSDRQSSPGHPSDHSSVGPAVPAETKMSVHTSCAAGPAGPTSLDGLYGNNADVGVRQTTRVAGRLQWLVRPFKVAAHANGGRWVDSHEDVSERGNPLEQECQRRAATIPHANGGSKNWQSSSMVTAQNSPAAIAAVTEMDGQGGCHHGSSAIG